MIIKLFHWFVFILDPRIEYYVLRVYTRTWAFFSEMVLSCIFPIR